MVPGPRPCSLLHLKYQDIPGILGLAIAPDLGPGY